ncbi:MAG: RNA polymerase sigma factor [Pseudomonadota bacterium]
MTRFATEISHLYREHAGRVLAALITQVNDFDLAEEALQDAWLEALTRWSRDGLPKSPPAWLLTVAKRRVIDRLRRRGSVEKNAEQLKWAYELEPTWCSSQDEEIPDERLRLIFTCCHPALKQTHQVALTLRTLCGLNTEQIASAFLSSKQTLAQRLVRAKRKIRDAGIPYRIPEAENLVERLDPVRAVIYLTFNEGYSATEGDALIRKELCDEAIRLGRLLHSQCPHPENAGLLALMLLHDSRRNARLDENGAYIPLDEQSRDCWCDEKLKEGRTLLLNTLAANRPGPFQIQAAISAVHADSKASGYTDWKQIVGLYDALRDYLDSPVVQLNRAVALANAEAPEPALSSIECLKDELAQYQPYHAARAELLSQLGQTEIALDAYARAIDLSGNEAERRYLIAKRDALSTIRNQ